MLIEMWSEDGNKILAPHQEIEGFKKQGFTTESPKKAKIAPKPAVLEKK